MRALILTLAALAVVSCGGSGSSNASPASRLAGSYSGNWTTTPNGNVLGPAAVSISTASAVTVSLSTAAVDPPTATPALSADGTVDSQGNFTGQTTANPPATITGTISQTSSGITATLTGVAGGGNTTWYVTAVKQ